MSNFWVSNTGEILEKEETAEGSSGRLHHLTSQLPKIEKNILELSLFGKVFYNIRTLSFSI